jgi:ATP-dependent helicase/nuclease subunit A
MTELTGTAPVTDSTDDPTDDSPARRAIRVQLGETLFVEAGAGTGKTTALVGRIVELVATGTAPLRAIAAITFTEAAAGELRDRIREELERLAAGQVDDEYADPGTDLADGERRARRAAEALTEVDGAAISTLHGFAQRVLAEHPFEAGLPPTFDVFDEIRSSVAFDEQWGDFLDRILDDPVHVAAIQRALVCGIRLDHLRAVAVEFNRNWDLVADHDLVAPTLTPVDAGPVVAALSAAVALADGCTDPDDKLLAHLTGLIGFARRLGAASDELETLQLIQQAPRLPFHHGRKGNWPDIDQVRGLLDTAAAARTAVLDRAANQALAHLLVAIRELTVAAADQRRRDGTLEFHDLLVQARDLLRRDPAVAARLRSTYTHLLIDEFQDTDPIQIELAVRIASTDPDAGTRRWDELTVPPGRLFFVGDPKQAIYRFRRADIGLFLDVRDAFVGAPLSLTRNRRSVPGLIEFVNAVFAHLIGEGAARSQPAYEPLVAHRPAHDGTPGTGRGNDPAGPPVVLLGGAVDDRRMAAVRAAEAADIATAVGRARAEGWPVGDTGRPATLADICVLIPTRTSLPALERAFDEAGLPYRVESSSLVYASAEVRDLLTVLRAVDDPTDEVSIVAALRSPLFGCGDDDLLTYVTAGGRWDYRARPPEALSEPPVAPIDGDDAAEMVGHPVVAALASLHELHRERWWHDVSGLIERVLVERRALELALDERRPRDVWRRLRFVADQARAFTDAYGTDLRRYLAWAELQSADDARVVEAILPESDDDAVRIMTVHASKGLEFPIVALSGLNAQDRGRRAGVEVLWSDDGPAVRLSKGLAMPAHADLARREDAMDAFEQLRLLYVAATRARDHLIVSLHHKAGTTCHAARLAALEDELAGLTRRLDPVEGPLTLPFAPGHGPADAAGTGAPDDDSPEARDRWIADRAHRLGPGAQPRTLAATTVARLAREQAALEPADEPGDDTGPEVDLDQPPWRRGRAGTAIGRAVHGVLQVIDLATGDGLAAAARAQAAAEGVAGRAGEVERLARAALEAEVVRRAVAGGRYWRELYVGAPLGSRVLEGFVDLLVEGADGLTVVDYKTDAAPTTADIDAAATRYRLQGASYAVAIEQALGRPVTRCVFLFLRPDGAVEREVADLAAAAAEVRAVLAGA